MNCSILILFLAAVVTADQWYGHQKYPSGNSHYYQPAPLNKDGRVAETPEVLAARARHFAALAEATAKAGDWQNDSWSYERYPVWMKQGQYKWNMQPAPLNPDGTVAETPEVQALRARHLAALAAAEARALSAPKWYPEGRHQNYWIPPVNIHPGTKAWSHHG